MNEIIDPENIQGDPKEKLSFKDIVLQHLKKISIFASVEFKSGYWETHKTDQGNKKKYVPDTNEIYTNSVECLSDLLFIYFDELMIVAEKTYAKEIIVILEKFSILDDDGERKFLDEDQKIIYRYKKRETAKKLFRELCSFLRRNGYLGFADFED